MPKVNSNLGPLNRHRFWAIQDLHPMGPFLRPGACSGASGLWVATKINFPALLVGSGAVWATKLIPPVFGIHCVSVPLPVTETLQWIMLSYTRPLWLPWDTLAQTLVIELEWQRRLEVWSFSTGSFILDCFLQTFSEGPSLVEPETLKIPVTWVCLLRRLQTWVPPR